MLAACGFRLRLLHPSGSFTSDKVRAVRHREACCVKCRKTPHRNALHRNASGVNKPLNSLILLVYN